MALFLLKFIKTTKYAYALYVIHKIMNINSFYKENTLATKSEKYNSNAYLKGRIKSKEFFCFFSDS